MDMIELAPLEAWMQKPYALAYASFTHTFNHAWEVLPSWHRSIALVHAINWNETKIWTGGANRAAVINYRESDHTQTESRDETFALVSLV